MPVVVKQQNLEFNAKRVSRENDDETSTGHAILKDTMPVLQSQGPSLSYSSSSWSICLRHHLATRKVINLS